MSRIPANLGPLAAATVARARTRCRRAVADAVVDATRWAEQTIVSGPDSRHAARFQHVGEGSVFAYPAGRSMGEQWIRIGADTLIAPRVALSAGVWPDEALAPESGAALRIGDRCSIGQGSSLVSRIGIDIGDDVILGPNVYITDHNHDYARPDVAIRLQWIVERPVSIGAGSWIGVGAVLLPGTTIGENVVVGAGSIVNGSFPDHCVVAGAPARVIRSWDSSLEQWDPPHTHERVGPFAPKGWYDDAI